MSKSKRFWISMTVLIILLSLAFVSAFKDMETLAITCIGSVAAIGASYLWGETKRPSIS